MDNQFLQDTIENVAMIKESEDQQSVITKDKAYIAAGKVLTHFKKLRGRQNSKFLEENFSQVWADHDEGKKNFLNIEKSVQFMRDLIDAE